MPCGTWEVPSSYAADLHSSGHRHRGTLTNLISPFTALRNEAEEEGVENASSLATEPCLGSSPASSYLLSQMAVRHRGQRWW